MLPLKIELRNFGITHFLIRPDGRTFAVFINLPVDLRKHLNSALSDKAVIDYALQQHWVLIELQRTTVKFAGITQKYRVIVRAERHTFGGKIHSYPRTIELLKLLERSLNQLLRVTVKLFDFAGGKSEIHSSFNSSADFAKIAIHTIALYNQSIERNLLLPNPPHTSPG
jgi:hypothetical protein